MLNLWNVRVVILDENFTLEFEDEVELAENRSRRRAYEVFVKRKIVGECVSEDGCIKIFNV